MFGQTRYEKRAVPEAVLKSRRFFSFLVLSILLPAVGHPLLAARLFDKTAKKQLTSYLDEICRWVMTTNVGGGSSKTDKDSPEAISVEGNLARVLMAGFELTKNNPNYLQEALQWCDSFVSQQKRVQTSKQNDGGYWVGQEAATEIDLGNAGLAAAALARGYVYAEGQRKKDYLQALERYSRFVTEGCKGDPQGKSRGGSTGWILGEGENKGAVGFGYFKDHVSTKPSTRATAASAALFSHLYAITKNNQYRDPASEAVRWILKVRTPLGAIPNVADGKESEQWPLDTATYCAEAALSAYYLLDDPNLNQLIAKEIEPTVRWLIRIQNDRGAWGEGPDQQRCSGAATLLAWFYLNVKGDEVIPQSLEKFLQILLNPVHSQSFGVGVQGHATGLVGLATAEMVKPGVTFKKL
jgi:hypothetical protein